MTGKFVMEKTDRVIPIPADVYDTLEFGAMAFGGIGAGMFNESITDGLTRASVPCCAAGMLMTKSGSTVVADRLDRVLRRTTDGEITSITSYNDEIVDRYTALTGRKRMPWREYVRATGFVRSAA